MGRVMLAAGVVAVATLVPQARGHGSLVVPPPRNSVERSLPMWAGGKHPGSSPNAPGMPTIEPFGCDCVNGTEPCESAQSVRDLPPPFGMVYLDVQPARPLATAPRVSFCAVRHFHD